MSNRSSIGRLSLETFFALIVAGNLHAQTDTAGAKSVYQRGLGQFENHQFVEAKESFQQAIQFDQNFSDAYRALGLAELELTDYNGAYQAWLKAVGLNPKDEKSKYCLGRLLFDANLPNEAAAWLRQALELNAKDYQAMTYLGLCAEALGFADTAERLYRGAIVESEAQHKPYSWAYLSLANYLKKQGLETQALPVLEAGAQKCPEAHELAAFGELLAAQGHPDRAESALRQAIALDPKLSQPHYRLGLILRSLGRNEEAKQEMLLFQNAKNEEDKAPKITALRKSAN